ncbi:DNA-binding protein [Acidimangrovimonas sediminis]|uniref:DNA-binding protein n=1 Tax=Acidimangrovimonas sediminis TaxID=2056283 RepID=UPI000C80E49F|nr:DNA-binding protein [Acidimangrovimonas sediminis]
MLTFDFTPRLLPAPQAAHYIGVSVSTLAKLPILRRELRGKRVYDRLDLDEYVSTLPYEGAPESESEEQSACDKAFGL